MTREVDVAIIGAGSAGLYALSQVRHEGKSFVLIDGGELGTTCARVGCMPSKVAIQVAEDFHHRKMFNREGIEGGDGLSIDKEEVMEYIQDLRDHFVDQVLTTSTDEMAMRGLPAQTLLKSMTRSSRQRRSSSPQAAARSYLSPGRPLVTAS